MKWLKTLRPSILRWPKNLPRSDLKEDVCDMITILIRVKGFPTSSTFQEWMYEHIIINKRKKIHINWGVQISDKIHEQLFNVHSTLKFYTTSYLVYVATTMRKYHGITTKGDRRYVSVHKYYSQITLRGSIRHFIRVNDDFFISFLCMFNPSLEKKRVSDEAWQVVNKYGCIFLQFPTFTYLRVGCYTGYPNLLPIYPSNKSMLMKLCRHIILVHNERQSIHKPSIKFPITIGRYSIQTMPKGKAIALEMQIMTLRTYRYINDFDYRGMKRKIKKSHRHVYRIENIWVDYKDEEDIRKMDYCRLTVEQISDPGLANLLRNFEDPRDVLNADYDEKEIERKPFPLIQWPSKGNTSIRKRLTHILSNTRKWLQRKGIQFKPFKTNFESEVSKGEASRKQELRTKNKASIDPSSSRRGPKITFTNGKSTTQTPKEEKNTKEEQPKREE